MNAEETTRALGGRMRHIVGLSGGKDSTAMALRLVEQEPRDYEFVCTPTGEEPPEWFAHMLRLEAKLGPIKRLSAETMESLIAKWQALPNFRQRWCTRKLKLEPFYVYVFSQMPVTCYVGLRADERAREGFATEPTPGFVQDFPLQRWNWSIAEVLGYLDQHQIRIDFRTDCMNCFFQRLGEWHALWRDRPHVYERYARWERKVGHTFRSPQRDTWPASLDLLAIEFAKGREPRKFTKPTAKGCAWCRA